jgi:hypothetical protein
MTYRPFERRSGRRSRWWTAAHGRRAIHVAGGAELQLTMMISTKDVSSSWFKSGGEILYWNVRRCVFLFFMSGFSIAGTPGMLRTGCPSTARAKRPRQNTTQPRAAALGSPSSFVFHCHLHCTGQATQARHHPTTSRRAWFPFLFRVPLPPSVMVHTSRTGN